MKLKLSPIQTLTIIVQDLFVLPGPVLKQEQQYSPERKRKARHRSELGLGLGETPIYKVDVVGWCVMEQPSL